MDLVSDEELAAASSGLEVPSGLYGFGNYLVWMVATRAPELVDAVYGSGVARPSPEYRMRDGHHLPTQSMFGWLILACRLGVDPARLPRGDRNLVSTQRSLAATMTPAMGAEPQRFRAEWLRDLAAVCGLDRAELRFLEVARSRFGVGLDPGELRLAVEATRAAGLPAGRHGGPGGGAAGPSAGPSAGTADRPGGAADGVIPDQLVIGQVPREPRGFVVRGLVGVLADAAAAGPVAVVCAVTGLRGVGKTQLAAAYARERIRAGWGLIGWIDAESRGTMVTGLAAVAGRLGVADPRGDSEASARRLRDHLQSRAADGLLVLDNATSPQDVDPFLPAAGGTQIVITSTNQAFSDHLGLAVDVPGFTRDESVRFLAERTTLTDLAGASELAEELGDLPLALAQAATVIRVQRLSYPAYRQRLRDMATADLLPAISGGYAKGVAAALLFSVQSAEAAAGGTAEGLTGRLLRVTAVLSPAGVRRDLLSDLATSAYTVDEAVQRCVAGSMLTWSLSGEELIMHRLLGRILRERDQLDGRWPRTVAEALDLLEARLFPPDEAWARRAEGGRLVAQVEAAWSATTDTAAARDGIGPDPRARLLRARIWAVRQLAEAADLSRAISIGEQVLADCLHPYLGPDDRLTLAARESLAVARLQAGQLAEAVSLCELNLAARRRLFGDDDPDTLETLDDLGSAHYAAARFAESAVRFEQALRGRERVLEAGHRGIFESRVNLAAAKSRAGRLDEAIGLDEQTLAERLATVGPDHADTLLVRANLAFKYRLGQWLDKATEMHEEIYEAWKRVEGPEHKLTLNSATNLGACYADVGRLADAAQLHEETLSTRLRVLGRDHPDTLVSRYALGLTYLAMERHREARDLLESSLEERLRILGPDSPDTLLSRHALARATAALGRYDEAIARHEENLEAWLRLRGPDDQHTRDTIDALEQARANAAPD